jgi:hypothetical protein
MKQLANFRIWSCERKLTVSCLIWGSYLSINYVAYLFLNSNLMSANLKLTPLKIDWAVSPA